MITPRVKTILITQARNVAEQIVALDSHQPLVIREDQKYDRIDSKLLKEANKLN